MTKLATLALVSLLATAASAQCTVPTGKALLLSRAEMARVKAGIVCDTVTPLEPLAIRMQSPAPIAIFPLSPVFSYFVSRDSLPYMERKSRKGLWLWLLGAGAITAVALWDRDKDSPPVVPPITPVPEPKPVMLLMVGLGLLALSRAHQEGE